MHACAFGRAHCGLRRIAAPTALERITDCTLGTLRCKGPSPGDCGVTTPREVVAHSTSMHQRLFFQLTSGCRSWLPVVH
eukprot:6809335-Alexandrium_andersonii.AAC.1